MKQLITCLVGSATLLLSSPSQLHAEKITVPFSVDGAWSMNSQPSVVYHNGKSYFAWINSKKNLVAASYNHLTGETKEFVVSTGYNDDFCSPALSVRANGQIILFASKNATEDSFYCWYSKNPEDISSWSASQKHTGYGISSTTPFAIDNDLVVFWRSKNNIGYSFYKDVQDKTSNLPGTPTKRAGFIGTDIGNKYAHREEIPYMRACQDSNGAIHMVITHLGTGLTYSNSTIHYVKIDKNEVGDGLTFAKADGTPLSGMNVTESKGTPLDTISSGIGHDKVWAYDIKIDKDNNPVILYDTFISDDNRNTTNHIYHHARWNGTQWVKNEIVKAENGLSISQYNAVGGNKFNANSYQAGGICFDAVDPSRVYLSKKDGGSTFNLHQYTTQDGGVTWSETEAVTSSQTDANLNIRPITALNATSDYPADMFWMQGSYSNPTDFQTNIMCRGEAVPTTGLFIDKEVYECAKGDELNLNVRIAPMFASDKAYTMTSSAPSVVEIAADNTLICKGVGDAVITISLNNNPQLSASCNITVLGQSVYATFAERIIADIRADKLGSIASLDQTVEGYVSTLQPNGSYPDIDYASTDRTNWEPLKHIDRMLAMALAYTHEASSYYESQTLKGKVDQMLAYWHSVQPKSNNWYQNEIGEPQRMGQFLILMQNLGKEKIATDLFDKSINRLRDKGGNPGAQAGANRVDVALHWMYRACLTSDADLMKEAMDYIYSTIYYTTGAEGIQYDNSFTQHGRQLHIGSYGDVFLGGITKACSYAAESNFAISGEQLDILSKLIKDTYIGTYRGEYISYNVIGRASTRPGATKKSGQTAIVKRMISLDPTNAITYQEAIARVSGVELPDYAVKPSGTHFFKSDYTLNRRPAYTADLRLVSTRTARNEYLKDNGEGIKQYFLSDGAMAIMQRGDEYHNIFPTWNYAKVPGVTCPEFIDIPQASTYIKMGQSNFVGGVTDSTYNVSVYKYTDYDTQFGVNTSANKAWFFFDNEIVCLGNNIKSTSALQVNTTLNQCLQKGSAAWGKLGAQLGAFDAGHEEFSETPDWVYHDGVAYYFPSKNNVELSLGTQTGKWTDINTNYSDEVVNNDVFTLSINHGVKPTDDSYAYIIVPGTTQEKASTYKMDDIEIIANNDSVQAVYNKASNTYGIIFYKAAGFNKHGLTIEADAGCALLVKDADKADVIIHVSDPTNGSSPINLGIETALIKKRRLITYQPVAPFEGSSAKFTVNVDTPLSQGRDVLANRADWTIVTSLAGPQDSEPLVGGDNPDYIIDDNTNSAFLFVKPGKTFSGIVAPADYIPSFTIDMKSKQELEYFIYRHRDYNNKLEYLRAKKISLYGKNAEAEEFTPIVESVSLQTSISENKVKLTTGAAYRYLKVTIDEWDTTTGSTIQVADFNIGRKVLIEIPETDPPTSIIDNEVLGDNVAIYLQENPIRQGAVAMLLYQGDTDRLEYTVMDTTGMICLKGYGREIPTHTLLRGIYLVRVKSHELNQIKTLKLIIQ